ncbi:thiamine pyrophosphate-dependent dehydrogenase E1 component subunit alpha [Amycolatopsis thermophila]|uniref:Pyruvate dehydrogenase E1 component alpha subunit n=1 Tax=Amycolatopsis thermophila TaxID=206084 RepID=A0ABU0F0K0_9PSEU|nr:thiamine pyrophosphate-dependent dehydrogenase E1 component subunit alpha [Amycolatopsis thermophila]MDQ0381093.1 pyruvate dehydrogenase E1 component alpha subunit [Amycolatopsis thermophila]
MTEGTDPAALPDEFAGPDGHTLALEMMRRMLRVRLFEEATIALFHAGELPAMVHLSIGQEAAVVGACVATTTADYMTGNHRSHGHPIAKGAGLGALMAELLGKATGVCGGKGGSMHLADFSVGSLGESGIVGSAIPVATGAGLAAQVRGSDQVALCFFGDGAANEGVLHESMNIAAIWKLPVIYFCENNGYAVSVRASESISVPDIATRAAGYSMPGVVVDGQDVLDVYRATRDAVARARAGDGPSLVEAKTYRFHEHAYGLVVPQPYRDQATVDSWFDTVDPITLFHHRLLGWGAAGEDELRALRDAVQSEVDAAVEFARESPLPPPEAAYTDLYAPSEVTA